MDQTRPYLSEPEQRTDPTEPNQTQSNKINPEQTRLNPTKSRPNRTAPTKNQLFQSGQQPPAKTTTAAADSSRQQQPRASRSKQRQTATSKETPDSNRQQHTAILKRKRYLNSRAAHRDKQRQTTANTAGVQNRTLAPRGKPCKISFSGGKELPRGRFSLLEVAGRAYLQRVIKQPEVSGAAPQGSEATVQGDFGLLSITELRRFPAITSIMIISWIRGDKAQSIDGTRACD